MLYDISDSNLNRIDELPNIDDKKNTFSPFWQNYFTTDSNPVDGDGIIYNPYDSCIAYGYDVVFGVAGIRCDTNMHYGTDEGQKLVNDLSNDRPCHLIMHNHRTYGDHSVLAIGYVDFTYDSIYNDPSSTYIRIADGWSSTADRYVWGSCYGTWNYISVIVY